MVAPPGSRGSRKAQSYPGTWAIQFHVEPNPPTLSWNFKKSASGMALGYACPCPVLFQIGPPSHVSLCLQNIPIIGQKFRSCLGWVFLARAQRPQRDCQVLSCRRRYPDSEGIDRGTHACECVHIQTHTFSQACKCTYTKYICMHTYSQECKCTYICMHIIYVYSTHMHIHISLNTCANI